MTIYPQQCVSGKWMNPDTGVCDLVTAPEPIFMGCDPVPNIPINQQCQDVHPPLYDDTNKGAGMEVAFDSNGYAYDTYTGNYVNIAYNPDGSAYDASTNTPIDTIIAPDNTTVYKQPTQ